MEKYTIKLLGDVVNSAKIVNCILIESHGLATYILLLDDETAVYINSNMQLFSRMPENPVGKTLRLEMTKNNHKYLEVS